MIVIDERAANERQKSNAANPKQNQLLTTILKNSKPGCFPGLTLVKLALGDALYESDQPIEFVYFPTNCIISLLNVMISGASAEIAVIGNEGMLGVSVVMGSDSTPNRAVVQSKGFAYRLPVAELKKELEARTDVWELTLRYTQALITQMSQTAACNRHHSIDQQLCRWLLLSLDRLHGNELTMTQELIANMLGVRREGVTEAAGKLQNAGIIQYRSGNITVVDRARLEGLCCECYAVVKRETDRLGSISVKP